MKQIKMYGLGGQGVVTAAKVFCEAVAIHEDGYAQAIPAYRLPRELLNKDIDMIRNLGVKIKTK